MKVDQAQIERLYHFTREHFVEWYDLQTELVDHLANAIEAQWQENPALSFDEALQREFKKFGVFGFMDVVEKRQAALNKKYQRLVWGHFKAFFTFPRIVLSLLFMAVLFLVQKLTDAAIVGNVLVVAILAMMLASTIRNIRFQNRKTAQGEKRWLFSEVIRSYGNMGIFFMIPMQVFGRFWDNGGSGNTLAMVLTGVFFVSCFLLFYIMMFVIPSKADAYLRETYPEYRLENV